MLIPFTVRGIGHLDVLRARKLRKVLMNGQADGLEQVNAAVSAAFTQNLYLITRYKRQPVFSLKGK